MAALDAQRWLESQPHEKAQYEGEEAGTTSPLCIP
jgi:hypothetical protein